MMSWLSNLPKNPAGESSPWENKHESSEISGERKAEVTR